MKTTLTSLTNDEELPSSYVIKKFYEYGFQVSYQKGNNTYTCCCPICHEGKSFGKKRRCLYIPAKNLIYCHNCGWSSRPMKWIMEVGGLTYKEVKSEVTNGEFNILNLDKMDNILTDNISINEGLPEDVINLTNPLQLEYYKTDSIVQKALAYIKERRLDTAINKPELFLSLNDPVHKNRIIIPFYDENKKVLHYQSRAFGASLDPSIKEIKYLTMRGHVASLYAFDRITDLDTVYITEGPLDACFIQNGVAVAGISKGKNFTSLQQEQIDLLGLNHKFIWVVDSQWVDDAARKKTKSLLEQGWRVFLWPKKLGLQYKDLNEICIDKKINGIPHKFIDENTISGDGGLLKFKYLFNN